MLEELLAVLDGKSVPELTFWESKLELHVRHLGRKYAKTKTYRTNWLKRLNGRQLDILANSIGLDPEESTQAKKQELVHHLTELFPYHLVERFAQNKSAIATIDFARRTLRPEECEACRVNDEKFDKTALLFAIYQNNPTDLATFYPLDKMQKSGFARLALKQKPRKPSVELARFLKSNEISRSLSEFDAAQPDGHTTEMMGSFTLEKHELLFLRRPGAPARIQSIQGVVHGYRMEWMILDFSKGGKVLSVCSKDPHAPLEIANLIATHYFGETCEYEMESRKTKVAQLGNMFKDLITRDGAVGDLVELVVSNSCLNGAPKLKITDPESISPGILHFESKIGSLHDRIDRIESLKVQFGRKRVSLIFEPAGVDGEFVVRYRDQGLNVAERLKFEDQMEKKHGIVVFSTEKCFKKQR